VRERESETVLRPMWAGPLITGATPQPNPTPYGHTCIATTVTPEKKNEQLRAI
jgi:hypothetical protein